MPKFKIGDRVTVAPHNWWMSEEFIGQSGVFLRKQVYGLGRLTFRWVVKLDSGRTIYLRSKDFIEKEINMIKVDIIKLTNSQTGKDEEHVYVRRCKEVNGKELVLTDSEHLFPPGSTLKFSVSPGIFSVALVDK